MLPPPGDFGLPFAEWRHYQPGAILDTLASRRRFQFCNLPTGAGKTLIGFGQAALTGERLVYLTETRALQDQAGGKAGEFLSAGPGLFDVRGMANYDCIVSPEELQEDPDTPGPVTFRMPPPGWALRADEGPCLSGWKCPHRESDCPYYAAYRQATRSHWTITNYAYWLFVHKFRGGLGPVDLLICDEGHRAGDALCDFLRVELSALEVLTRLRLRWPDGLEQGLVSRKVRTWAAKAWQHAKEVLGAELRGQHGPKEAKRARALVEKLDTLATAEGAWIARVDLDGWTFEPVWPAHYSPLLFQNAKRVVIMGATVTAKDAGYLGLGPEHYDMREYPSVFPPWRRPMTWVPTARLYAEMGAADTMKWRDTIDRIAAPRVALTKGIIHTVSYRRMERLKQISAYREVMLTHTKDNVREVVAHFKRAAPPCILVSPVVHTGWNFPDEEVRWQIVAKINFPDRRDPLVAARTKDDPEWPYHFALTDLVQKVGRGVRSRPDWCETFIVDDAISWLRRRHQHLAPGWFWEAWRVSEDVSRPMIPMELPDR